MKIRAENILAKRFMVQLKVIWSVLKIYNKRITALNLFLIYINISYIYLMFIILYFLFSLWQLMLWVPYYL